MQVLMISIDRTLLGADYSGDALERHKEYAKRAGSLDVIVFSKRGYKKIKVNNNLTIYPTNSLNPLTYIFDAYKIACDICIPDKFDLIVTQDPFLTGLAGWVIKKRFDISLLMHFHGDFWQNKHWLFERWFNPFCLIISKFLVDGADGIRVVSTGIKRKLIKNKIKKDKIRVIPTPVDLKKFQFFDLNKVKEIKKKHNYKKTIINVGRKDASKDYNTLFKAIKLTYEKCRNLAFWQIGADLNLLGKIRADENLLLVSNGKVNQKELVNYYHASDIYVSSSRHESFGKVLVEAMTAGLPVIATATTGSRDIIVDGETGFLVPIGDSQAIAKKILFLISNPNETKRIVKNAKQMVKERFSHEKTIDEIIKFWKELAKRK